MIFLLLEEQSIASTFNTFIVLILAKQITIPSNNPINNAISDTFNVVTVASI